uniref:EF-hand domain-containing protein n=1 Tax=Noctiluca scintillans TaxID=2966 RepID=A0A7S1F886_NOCSC|mmetsp:Transcript_40287/g.106880  ORF Transcript_40287/g.106880 Transcript_40287/m.106880 type:complete len:801 (+) Transcript_40287:73-2475(+)
MYLQGLMRDHVAHDGLSLLELADVDVQTDDGDDWSGEEHEIKEHNENEVRDESPNPYIPSVKASARSISLNPGVFFLGDGNKHLGSADEVARASSRSITVLPNVMFLGNKKEDENEIPLWTALETDTLDQHNCHADPRSGREGDDVAAPETSEHFDEFMTMWLMGDQMRLKDRMEKFARKQQLALERHRQLVDYQLVQQRTEMRKALVEARRHVMMHQVPSWSSSNPQESLTSLVSISPDVPQRHSTQSACSEQETVRGSVLSLTSELKNAPGTTVARTTWEAVAAGLRASSRSAEINDNVPTYKTECGFMPKHPHPGEGDVNSESIDQIHVHSQERSLRLREAYETAAQRFRTRRYGSRLGLDRISLLALKNATIKETFAHRHFFGCRRIHHLVMSKRYTRCVAGVVFANAIFVAMIARMTVERSLNSYDRRDGGNEADVHQPVWVDVLDACFTLLFAFELVLRIVGLEGQFCIGTEWRWNLFDAVVTILGVTETALRIAPNRNDVVGTIRVVQVLRTARLLRLLRFSYLVPKLRVMTLAIVNCSTMLMWAVVIVILLVFLFSIVFLHGASQYISGAGEGDIYAEDMRMFFGSLSMTMLTLFMAVSGGIDWWDIQKLLLEVHVSYALVFLLFVIITVLAVLNVINAIFVNDAMESTRQDHALRMQGELDDTRFMLERLTVMFQELQSGCEGDGVVLETEFVTQVEREDVKMQFALLGVHFTDSLNFFKLLDVDRNGTLAIDEFVMGCLRLKGHGILIDIDVLARETQDLAKTLIIEHRRSTATLEKKVQEISDRMIMNF